MEITIKIVAPELATSINNLAAALALSGQKRNTVIPDAKHAAEPEMDVTSLAATETEEPAPIVPEVKEEIPVEKAEEPAPLVEEKVFTLEEVRAKLATLSQSGKQAKVKELITKMGAIKLSDIPAEKYGEVMKEAEAIK